MPVDSQFLADTPGLGRRSRRLSAWVQRLGWWRATLVAMVLSVAASVALTWVFVRGQGYAEMGEALTISVTVSALVTLLGAGLTLRLVLALEQARQVVQSMAMTDVLTGVRNRRYFMHCAQRHFELARRHHLPLALLIFDIDHFKRINDEHGHLQGDRLLTEICERCQALMRGSDLLARFGGEEFIVLMPNTQQAQAVVLAERLRAAVSQVSAETGVLPTVSVGVVALGEHMPTLDALIQAADEALYAAKRGGRDQVRTQPIPLSQPMAT